MLVLLNGIPFFSKKTVKDLNDFDTKNYYIFCNTYESKLAQLKFILLLPFCNTVISFNGVSDESKSLNWVMKFNKKLIMQWHGTDVKLAKERMLNGSINRKYIDYAAIHLASAQWFVEELHGIVPEILYAPFGYVDKVGNDRTYDEIKILTYIGNGNEEFYGWNDILRISKEFPNIHISVVGTEMKRSEVSNNIDFWGWVSEAELIQLMKEHPIFIRLTEHDGKAITVSQALAVGSEVLWTYPYPNCHQINQNSSELFDILAHMISQINKRGMKPNEESIKFAKKHLLKETVMIEYLEVLKQIIND